MAADEDLRDYRTKFNHKRHSPGYGHPPGAAYYKIAADRADVIAAAHIILWSAHRLRAIGVRLR